MVTEFRGDLPGPRLGPPLKAKAGFCVDGACGVAEVASGRQNHRGGGGPTDSMEDGDHRCHITLVPVSIVQMNPERSDEVTAAGSRVQALLLPSQGSLGLHPAFQARAVAAGSLVASWSSSPWPTQRQP